MKTMKSVIIAMLCSRACGLVANREEPLAPVCYDITCADIDCLAPFELRRAPGQCCPVCFASEEDVALDRHTALEGKNPYLVAAAAAAPTTCSGVKCFKPHCFPGYAKGFVQGRCCESCVPGR
mmetsp:Transcript_90296/g.141538  ORF Transcript_90296/g.141538 Transcript_90296/m.141538 type:complete len:123 (+) Transcript_90296:52-420(+)